MTAVKVIRRFRELKDVTFGTPADGDAVVYDAATDDLILQAGGAGGPGPAGPPGPTGPAGPAASVPTDTIWNVKGDLAVATGNDTATRLGVGSNGQVLTADSAQTTGVKWAAAAGGSDWTVVTKPSDESVVSSTTLQNDDHLFFATVAAAVYEIECCLIYTGNGNGVSVAWGEDADHRRGTIAMTGMGPSGTTKQIDAVNTNQTLVLQFGSTTLPAKAARGSGVHVAVGGTFRMLWTQITSDSAAVVVKAGSVLRYRRVV